MKKILFSCAFVAFCCIQQAYAQQDPQFSQFMFNRHYLNPAATGNNPNFMEFSTFFRSQWTAYTPTFDDGGAPNTITASFTTPIPGIKSGAGLLLVNDRIGAISSMQAQLSYAYHAPLKNGGTLSFGLRSGLFNLAIDGTKFRYEKPDPLIPEGRVSEFKPDLAFGMQYSTEKYWVGLSSTHLLMSKFKFDALNSITSLVPHLYLMGGAHIDASETVKISPSAIVKTDFNSLSLDLNVLGTFNEQFLAGLGARASNNLDDIIFMLGGYFLKDRSLRAVYSIDLVMSGQAAKQPTSNEVSLFYRVPMPKPPVPTPLRTPRFRF